MKGSLREAQFIAHHEPFMTFGNVPIADGHINVVKFGILARRYWRAAVIGLPGTTPRTGAWPHEVQLPVKVALHRSTKISRSQASPPWVTCLRGIGV